MRWIWISACLALGACKSAEPMSPGNTDPNRSAVYRRSGHLSAATTVRPGNANAGEPTRGDVSSGTAPRVSFPDDLSSNRVMESRLRTNVTDTFAATASAEPIDPGAGQIRTKETPQSDPPSDRRSVRDAPPSVPLSASGEFQHTDDRPPAVTVSIPSGGISTSARVTSDPLLAAPIRGPSLSRNPSTVVAPAQSLSLFSGGSAVCRSASPVAAGIPLPSVPAAQNGVGDAGEPLVLPSPGTNRLKVVSQGSSLGIPHWVAGSEPANGSRETDADRRAREQRDRETEFNRLRRAFYGFLSVKADD